MDTILLILLGVAIGWITKIPFLLKWYKEYNQYKEDKVRMYNNLMSAISKLSKEEQKKHSLTAAYFKASN